jgi:hypothetical protein
VLHQRRAHARLRQPTSVLEKVRVSNSYQCSDDRAHSYPEAASWPSWLSSHPLLD